MRKEPEHHIHNDKNTKVNIIKNKKMYSVFSLMENETHGGILFIFLYKKSIRHT